MTVRLSTHALSSCVVETDALRWFQQVADGATVTDVSAMEHITQPGLSRALARLEAEVGTPLLRRQGRTLRMTEAGSAFKRHVDAMLHDLDDGLATVEQLLDPETGVVGIAFERSMGTWLLPQLVSGFQAEHPAVRIRLHHSGDVGPDGATEGGVDMTLTSRRPPGTQEQWSRLLSEPLVLVVAPRHPLAGRGPVYLADLGEQVFVTLRAPSPFRQASDVLFEGVGLTPTIGFEADDLATVQGFVAAGLGVAVVPASSLGERCEVVALGDPGARREIGLVWSEERRLLRSAALFRDHVLRQARAGRLAAPFT